MAERVTEEMVPNLDAIQARCDAATEGPWCAESVGEKGDGSDVIGVAFGSDDQECDRPLSGWLDPFNEEGDPVDYYRDEVVAECDHRNRNSYADASFIAHARTDVPALVNEIRRLREAALAAEHQRDLAVGALRSLREALAMGPLEVAAKYGPDGPPPEFLVETACRDADRVLRQLGTPTDKAAKEQARRLFTPVEVFHPSEYIAEEAIARGWTIWNVARRMGGDAQVNVLALQIYAVRDPHCHTGDAADLERAFGIRAVVWLSLEAYWMDHPEARSQSDDQATYLAWYEMDNDDE